MRNWLKPIFPVSDGDPPDPPGQQQLSLSTQCFLFCLLLPCAPVPPSLPIPQKALLQRSGSSIHYLHRFACAGPSALTLVTSQAVSSGHSPTLGSWVLGLQGCIAHAYLQSSSVVYGMAAVSCLL